MGTYSIRFRLNDQSTNEVFLSLAKCLNKIH